MNLITEITMPPAGRPEEEVMHLFDSYSTEEKALCGGDISADCGETWAATWKTG